MQLGKRPPIIENKTNAFIHSFTLHCGARSAAAERCASPVSSAQWPREVIRRPNRPRRSKVQDPGVDCPKGVLGKRHAATGLGWSYPKCREVESPGFTDVQIKKTGNTTKNSTNKADVTSQRGVDISTRWNITKVSPAFSGAGGSRNCKGDAFDSCKNGNLKPGDAVASVSILLVSQEKLEKAANKICSKTNWDELLTISRHSEGSREVQQRGEGNLGISRGSSRSPSSAR